MEEHLDETDMSKECKDEVSRDMNRMAQDFRLNWRLNHACESDINKLCPNLCSTSPGQTCGGLVLQCLQVSSKHHAAWGMAARTRMITMP